MWAICPLCRKPLKWVRLWDNTWSPCDDEPVLYLRKPGAKMKIVKRHELVPNCAVYSPRKDRDALPIFGRLPHYYSCPVLREERRAWAIANR